MSPCCSCHSAYSPVTIAVMYVEIFGVVGNTHTPSSRLVGVVFETTTQSSGACTVKVKVAFRSGWSKHAYTRCASFDSNCE